jgi:DnaJ-class molecular chaperone
MPQQEKRDYYEILGVARDADNETLKKAYRVLAMANHPDRNPGDKEKEELFKEAAEAYAVLRDDDRRAIYDTFGHSDILTASVEAMANRMEAMLRKSNETFEEMLAATRETNRRLQEIKRSLEEANQRSQSILNRVSGIADRIAGSSETINQRSESILDKATRIAERSDDTLEAAKKLFERVVNSQTISR